MTPHRCKTIRMQCQKRAPLKAAWMTPTPANDERQRLCLGSKRCKNELLEAGLVLHTSNIFLYYTIYSVGLFILLLARVEIVTDLMTHQGAKSDNSLTQL